jgi:hypothetical protein
MKGRFLQEPHGVTTQKTPFFIVTAVKTSNLTMPRLISLSRGSRVTERELADPLIDRGSSVSTGKFAKWQAILKSLSV